MASSQRDACAPSFFTVDDEGKTYPFKRDEVSDACLHGSLTRSDEWQEFPPPGRGDPGYFEFIVRVLPTLRDFLLCYSGFAALRHFLGYFISGMIHRYNAKHLAVIGQKVGNDNNYREQVAVLKVVKVGSKQHQSVVEKGDFVVVKRNDQSCPALVKGVFMSLVDGEELLVVQPVRSKLGFTACVAHAFFRAVSSGERLSSASIPCVVECLRQARCVRNGKLPFRAVMLAAEGTSSIPCSW
jgi:hypothetical protein